MAKESDLDVNSLVWFDDGSGVYYMVPGTLVKINETTSTVHADGRTHEIPTHMLKRREETGPEGVNDMMHLRDLHEGSVIYNLKKRYHRAIIYTYVGNILFAVNPYQLYNIYGLETVRKYENQLIGKLPPHIFSLANAAHYNMMKSNENQVIVISGESGSGKTESTKLVMQYLAAVDSTKSNLITEQILETNPLLESFGNAKTFINDNSSRFGKYIEMMFENGQIAGAGISEYLLEKSRIVYQNPGDRNFHIFYEMLAGLPHSDLKEMGLTRADHFFYLNQGSSSMIQYKNDAHDFQQVISAMEVLGINSEERQGIFCILAAILHLGNIYYGRTQRNGQEAAVIMNQVEVEYISKLLQVEITGVAKSLTQKVTDAAGEKFHTPFNVEQALDSRDGLARALYSRLFTWLVSRINQICNPKQHDSQLLIIAVLDIFGFEDFDSNGFEQFCINYANEYLQSFFIEHVFKQEQEEYAIEKIDFDPVVYEDNQACIDLIAKPPVGIIHILGDESNFPQATDRSFLEKCHQQHGQNKCYVKPKVNGAEFGIVHYAGLVTYQADMFLDKNRDVVRPELLDLLISSQSIFIANLFPEFVNNPDYHPSQVPYMSVVDPRISNSTSSSRENSLTRRNKFNMGRVPTVGGSFNESLNNLIMKMNESKPFFIRCIRSNIEKSPVLFQDGLVMAQIIYSGTMETIEIRRSGYPVRLLFNAFVRRYFCLHIGAKLNLKNEPYDNSKKICESVVKRNNNLKMEYQLGQTKIFMREEFERYLEEIRFQKLRENAILIQRNIKKWICTNDYAKKRVAAVILQNHIRGFITRKAFQRAMRGIIKFQSLYRMYKDRKYFLHNRTNELNRISKRQREYLSQVHYADKLEHEKIIDVTRFDIPPDLAVVFSRLHLWEPLHLDHHICGVSDITPWDFAENSLPGDIDMCYFSKFVKQFFQDNIHFSYTRVPLRSSLTKLKYTDIIESVLVFKLIMRFMDDHTMVGLRQLVLGNYIINKGIRNLELRDEIYSQLCMQVWANPNEQSLQRGWLLIGLCLCCFPPTPKMYKYLLKFVSDHGYNSYKSYCQRKILCWENEAPGRLFPPTLLEWKALKEIANLSIECEMADGYQRIIEVESSSSGENVAKSFLNVRDIADPAVTGWSFYLQFERSCRMDIAGSDPVLDLVAILEQPAGFPCSMAGTVLSLDRSNPIPSGRREIIIETHKPITNRLRVERLRQVYSEELSKQPLVFQEQQQQQQQEPDKHFTNDLFNEDLNYLPNNYALNNNQLINRQETLIRQSYLEHERYQRDMDEAHLQRLRQLEEEHQQKLENERMKQRAPTPPPAPPPPPILSSASQPTSQSSSAANTMKAKKKKDRRPPYSLDEVLERSNELKYKRDERASTSHSTDHMLDYTLQNGYHNDQFDKDLHYRMQELSTNGGPYLKQYSKTPQETYTVGEMVLENKQLKKNIQSNIVTLDDDIRAFNTGDTVSRKLNTHSNDKEPQSILGKSPSKSSKNRFESIAKKFENRKNGSIPKKPYLVNYGQKPLPVSAYVDELFDPVFAGEDKDLMSGSSLVGKLKGGGRNNYYNNRSGSRYQLNSSLTSNSSQKMLIDQLLQQQQYLQDTRDERKQLTPNDWDSEAINVTNEIPRKVSFGQGINNTVLSVPKSQSYNEFEFPPQTDEWRNIPPPPNIAAPPPPSQIAYGIPEFIDLSKSNRMFSNQVPDVIKGFDDDITFQEPLNKPHHSLSYLVPGIDSNDSVIRSILHTHGNESYLTYGNTRWKVYLKKEIFYPNEIMNATLKHLIYRQILEDLGSRTCCRLSGEDRYKMQRLLDTNTPSLETSAKTNTIVQESIIKAAKESPLYFARVYPTNGYTERALSSYIAVSHSGIRFAMRANLEEELKPTSHFKFTDIIDIHATKEKLTLETVVKKFVLHTIKAPAIKKLIDLFMKSTEMLDKYVRALSDFTAPNKDYISFKKENIIRVFDKKDVEPGCMWGIIGDFRGKFPMGIVEEYDHLHSIAPGWGPSVVPSKIMSLDVATGLESDQYSMVEFAMRYYRQNEAEAAKMGSLRKKLSKKEDDWTWKSVVALVKYSKEPLPSSLINFNNKGLSRQASDVFKAIMKFMGDLKREKQETNSELIYYILKIGREILDMRDEIFCQLAKQTTNNRSENRESCSRGWKLLILCTAYFDCSQLLRPYLNKYFQSAGDPKREFHAAANVCELNLLRSFKYGGRKQAPTENELFMLMQGKNAKHQIVNLPGNIQKRCKIQTSTTAYDLVKDICLEMGLHAEHEHEEYGLFTFLEQQQLLLPVQDQDYVFDVFAQLERQEMKFSLAFRKIIWFQTMRFGNNLFSEFIFNQVLPDVMNGYMLHHRGSRASHIRNQQTQNEIALLAALNHRVNDKHLVPSVHEVSQLIPPLVSSLLSPSQWVLMVQDHFKLVKHFAVMNARTKFLELISAWAYFGSSFFYIKHCSHTSVNGECILAINKLGVHFLAVNNRDTLLSYAFNDIISTRHLRTDSGRMFVDLKCGNLMVQRVTRLETPRGKEISNLIGQYIRCISLDRQKDHTAIENV